MTDSSNNSFLALILDLNLANWIRFSKVEFSVAFERICVYLNAFSFLREENLFAVIGVHKQSKILFKSHRNKVSKILKEQIQQFALIESDLHFTSITSGISQALCLINQLSTKFDSRIMIVSSSPDTPSTYVNMMNSIFAAQKKNVIIDVCQMGDCQDFLLQQASSVTGGSHFVISNADDLLHFLMSVCLLDHKTRQEISTPHQDNVEHQISCFCHGKFINIGYICAVCLSIYCSFKPICSVCKTKFDFASMRKKL